MLVVGPIVGREDGTADGLGVALTSPSSSSSSLSIGAVVGETDGSFAGLLLLVLAGAGLLPSIELSDGPFVKASSLSSSGRCDGSSVVVVELLDD